MQLASADRLIGRLPVWPRAVLAMLVLCGALGLMVESRARILRDGAEVRLKTAPIDPRDLFRGDYVVLNYEISTVEVDKAPGERDLRVGETIYVRLAPGTDGFARAVGASKAKPAPATGETIIEGRVDRSGTCLMGADGAIDCARGRNGVRVDYGIESFFVPQGEGLAIEQTERGRIEVVAAVAPSGQAAIKRLLIDGKPLYDEPPY